MNWFSLAVVVSTLATILRVSVPYAAAALGGLWCEKSGIMMIGLEGFLLLGAFLAASANASGVPALLALLLALLGCAGAGALLAWLVERARVHAVIVGLAFNLFVFGFSRAMLRAFFGSTSNSPPLSAFEGFALGGSTFGPLFRFFLAPTSWIVVALFASTLFVFRRTRLGLSVRAAGENPKAAFVLGVSVLRTRVIACAIGGGIAGLGGIALAFDQRQFQSGMSAGRGFIALAIVILSGWRIERILPIALTFALLDTVQLSLQNVSRGASQLFQAAPYLVTLLALALVRSRNAAPKGMGVSA